MGSLKELSHAERKRVDFVAGWITRMNDKFGARVYYDDGWYDWGQALCAENYGHDPDKWPFCPSEEDLETAKEWEEENFPEWLNQPEGSGE